MIGLLRDGVLDGTPVCVAGTGPLGAAVAEACGALGAQVRSVQLDPFGPEAELSHGDGAVVVWDGAAAFAAAGELSVRSVRAALDGAWIAIRPAGTIRDAKLILLAPPPGSSHAEAARAGLENLARTLGIEWARLNHRTVAILPGDQTTPDDVAQLVAYLASPAGDYFSGCALTLDAAA